MQPVKKELLLQDRGLFTAKKSVRVRTKEIADSSESDSTCLQVSKVANTISIIFGSYLYKMMSGFAHQLQ